MDCPICFKGIHENTGKTVLSCGHVFHVRCIGVWFGHQIRSAVAETCPNCRHQASDLEKMAPNRPVVLSLEELAKKERVRIMFERIKYLNPESELQLYATNLIRACWRAYQDRKLYKNIRNRLVDTDYLMNRIRQSRKWIRLNRIQGNFYKKLIGLEYEERRNLCARMIQSCWRR